MSKNLLQGLMVKERKKEIIKKNSFDLEGLTEKITSGYTAGIEPEHKTKTTFAPSTLVYGNGECPRYWYFAFSGANFEETSDAFGIANRTNGTYSHERIQKALIQSGIVKVFEKKNEKTEKIEKTTEFEIRNDSPPIYGKGDGIINWNNEELLLEIKTAPVEGFEYRKRTGKAKKDHILQTLIYMKILGYKRGVILYENKNTHELLAIPLEVGDYYREYVNNAFDWMRVVRASWMKNELPIKNYRSNSKICKNCPVQKTCNDAGTGVVKIASLEELRETM
jgi:CRISPR/Cas system-associated exonuclease Cas4 (RecB family)